MKRLDDQWQQKKRSTNVHRLLQNHPIGNEIKASGKIVDKIIDEINQRRPPADPAAGGVVNLGRGGGGNGSKTGKTRYLGRMAVTSKIAHSTVASTKNSVVQGTSDHAKIPSPKTQNGSFGPEYDEDVLCAMDKLEKDYMTETERIKSEVGGQMNFATAKDHPERVVPIAAPAELDIPRYSSPTNIHSGKFAHVKAVETAASHTHAAIKNRRQQSKALETPKLERPTLAASSFMVTEVVKGHLGGGGNAELDFSSTWGTPLHVSTPANGNKGRRRLPCASPKASSQANLNTPKTLSTKPREKTKLFQAILSSDNENDSERSKHQSIVAGVSGDQSHSSSNCDHQTISSATSHKSKQLPEQGEVTAQQNMTEHQSPDTSSPDDRLLLSSWGLPETILDNYKAHGITKMFEWQAECLCVGNALAHGNLIYAAPTSAGKTMVAELLMLKCVLETKKKALFILPFVSVAREKVSYLQGLFKDAGVRVDGYFGHTSPAGGFSSVDIAICTIEKANNLVNRLLEDQAIDQLGIVVVDELHMVGDSGRGYLLELLLTKLRFVVARLRAKEQLRKVDSSSSSSSFPNPIQVVGMSATLPNLDLLAHWLNADLYRTDFRPVPLTEMVKIGLDIFDSMLNKLRSLNADQTFKNDEDRIIPLCLETIGEGCSVLIFCPTKNWCEKLADTIAREFFRVLLQPSKQTGFVKASELVSEPLNCSMLRDVVEQLRRTPVGLDPMLGKMIPCGVAFHHAGLTFDERDIVEGAFRLGALKVLVATSTLSSGVNLPARRVIVRTPVFHGAVVDTMSYRQMIGRAGRKGVDTKGESILVCKASERHMAHHLLTSELSPVSSCLFPNSSGSLTSSMKRAILEIVVSKVASTPEEVDLYARCTMLAAEVEMKSSEGSDPDMDKARSRIDSIQMCINYLKEHEFIILSPGVNSDRVSTDVFTATQLGSAVVASGLSPDEGLVVFGELQKARRCFVLENELHTVYLVTPVYMQDQWATLDWYQYLCLWEQLPQDMKRVAELVGVQERFLARAAGGRVPCETVQQARLLATHKRFYSALVLHDLVNEMPLSAAVRKYGCTRGVLQSLQQSASTFAGMVTVFCNKLGWSNLEMLLSQFQSRLSFGVQPELVDLVRISLLNGQRARIVYNGGYATVAMVAAAEPTTIEKLLHTASPFLSKKKADDEMDWELEERLKSRCIFATGQNGLTEREAAVLIVEEARELLKDDLQHLGIEWKPALKSEKEAKENNAPGERRIAYKRPKTVNKERKNTSKKSENGGISMEGSSSVIGSNRSVLTPPPSMRRLTQQRSLLRRDSTPSASCISAEGRGSWISNAPVQLETDLQPANVLCSSENDAEQVTVTVPNAVASALIDSGQLSSHRKCEDVESPDSSVAGVDEAMLIMSESNTSATMHWCPNRTLEPQVADVLNGPCVMENTNQSMVSQEQQGHLNVHVQIVADDAGDVTMEISDTSLMLDTQTLRMITNATNADGYLSKGVQNQPTVTTDTDQVNSCIKDVPYAATVDTPLLFSEADGDQDVCQFTSSFLTQKPVNVCASVCNEFQGSGPAQPQICREMGNATNLRSVGRNASNGCDMNEQYVEPTFTNLVPLSNYERERCSGEGRFSDVLFENGDSEGDDDDAVVRNSPAAFAQTAKNNEILTRREGLLIDVVDKAAALSDDSIFANSDAFDLADESDNRHVETVAVVGLPKNTETFTNLETEKSETRAFITDSLTTSMIAKVLADGELQMSDQNESLFDDCLVIEAKPKVYEHIEQIAKASELVEMNRYKRDDIQDNVPLDRRAEMVGRPTSLNHKVQNLSPEMESIMNTLCGTRSRAVPKRSSKRTKSNVNVKNQELNCAVEKETKRIRQSDSILEEEEIDSKENYCENQRKPSEDDRRNQGNSISSGSSDSSACIPPTPPSLAEDMSKTATPKRLLGGVVGTPKKPNSMPPLAIKPSDADNNEVAIRDNFIPANRDFSRHLEHSPDRDATQVLQQNRYAGDDSGLISMTQSFTVIDVASNRLLFENFIKEWRCRKSFSLSLACERCVVTPQRSRSKAIGSKFTAVRPKEASVKTGLHVEGSDVAVVGLAISWENCDVYYVSLEPSDCNSCDLDHSLAAPPLDESLSVRERLQSVKSVLEEGESPIVNIYDLKEQYKLLCSFCGVVPCAQFADVKVACWLMDPDAKEKNLHSMVANYCPSMCSVLDGTGCGAGVESLGLTVNNSTTSGRIRASTEAVVVNHLMNSLTTILRKSDLHRCFSDVEMPAVAILAKMELNGMGFSEAECDMQRSILQAKMEALEERAYQLAGHPFSLTSTDDVSQVLFVELRLPPTGDPSAPVKTLGTTNRGKSSRGRQKQSFSTSKDILEKLKSLHPLPMLLLEWRRISSALTKVVFPLQKEKSYNANLDMFRIYGKSDFQTSTGRVTMHEPNLQNIPKDFEIAMPGVAGEESTDGSTMNPTVRGHRGSVNRQVVKDVLANIGPSYSVSMRNSFVSFKGGILLAADYSQLELRIIAHLSKDRKLIDVLNGGEDVFKAIASQLKMVSVESVTTEQRQQAKQVCYGMIYGIGPPALAEQLGVSANEASVFIETFKDKYTGMRRFLHETVKSCRDEGYVKMISGRVRHLPAIKDTNPHSRAHAERQAVNSTVQGSGADLVKTAMIRIDRELAKKFPETVRTHRHLRNDSEGRTRSKVSQLASKVRGAYFILQLHDELIYEVHQADFKQVAHIIKENMENALTLSVKLPVKLKAGPSWGCMHDVEI